VSLADRNLTPRSRQYRYRVDEILDELDAPDRAVLEGWLADLSLSPELISDELAAEGHAISAGSVATYRFRKLGLGERRR
jgi:hypothetical protein